MCDYGTHYGLDVAAVSDKSDEAQCPLNKLNLHGGRICDHGLVESLDWLHKLDNIFGVLKIGETTIQLVSMVL